MQSYFWDSTLASRGVLEIKGETQDVWDLPEDTREELAEVFVVHHMAESFHNITKPDEEEE